MVLPMCMTSSQDSTGINALEQKARAYEVSSVGCFGIVARRSTFP